MALARAPVAAVRTRVDPLRCLNRRLAARVLPEIGAAMGHIVAAVAVNLVVAVGLRIVVHVVPGHHSPHSGVVTPHTSLASLARTRENCLKYLITTAVSCGPPDRAALRLGA